MTINDVYHSRPIDVHRLTDYPAFNEALLILLSKYPDLKALYEKKSKTKKSKGSFKSIIKVVLLDLYVCHLEDEAMCLGVSTNNNSWNVGSRYNTLHISRDIRKVVRDLETLGLLDTARHWHSTEQPDQGRTMRYKASSELVEVFDGCSLTLDQLAFNPRKETIILRSKDVDELGEPIKGSRLIEYEDTLETRQMRANLLDYNYLLSQHHIDLSSLIEPVYVKEVWDKRTKQKRLHRVQVAQHNKYVYRVFSRGSFDCNGRFYGAWWMQIPKELRAEIVIDGNPTLEVDYKAIHPHLLASIAGKPLPKDPYTLNHLVIEGLSATDQRKWIKALVLQCINAKTKQSAFKAFRSKADTGSLMKKAKDAELNALLNAFIDAHPQLKDYLCSDWGIRLMRTDSEIVDMVVKQLTDKGIPVLTVHDSFIVQTHHFVELRCAMTMASIRVAGRDLFAEQDGFEVDRGKGYGRYKYKAILSKSKKVIGDCCSKRLRLFWRQRGMRLVQEPINHGFLKFWKHSVILR